MQPIHVAPRVPSRLVVLASGTGSLLESLLAAAVGDYPARVVAVGDSTGRLVQAAGQPARIVQLENDYGAVTGERWEYDIDGKTVGFTIRNG